MTFIIGRTLVTVQNKCDKIRKIRQVIMKEND